VTRFQQKIEINVIIDPDTLCEGHTVGHSLRERKQDAIMSE